MPRLAHIRRSARVFCCNCGDFCIESPCLSNASLTTARAGGGTSVPEQLGRFARSTLILGGLALAVGSLLLWLFPVQHSKPAPDSAKCTDSATCWVKVDDAPELLLSTLLVLGALLFLVGANGRKITSFKGPGGTGFDTAAPKAADEARDKTEQQATEKGLSDTERSAAKLVAEAEAQARTHFLEKVAGRPLAAPEIEQVAQDAAIAAVERVRRDPGIQ